MSRRIIVLLLSSFGAACAAGRAPTAPPAPALTAPAPAALPAPAPVAPSAFTATTESLIQRPEIRILVDELAATSRKASEHVGYDGHRSPEYATYERLRTAATDAEMIALLGHRSPVVRSYAAQHVIERDLEDASSLGPLLQDPTPLSTQYGCLSGTLPVSRTTVQALCDSRARPMAARMLAELAQQPRGDMATVASRCLAFP